MIPSFSIHKQLKGFPGHMPCDYERKVIPFVKQLGFTDIETHLDSCEFKACFPSEPEIPAPCMFYAAMTASLACSRIAG